MNHQAMHTIVIHIHRKFCASIRFALITIFLTSTSVHAVDISFTDIQKVGEETQRLTWDAFGQRWHAEVNRDSYLGEKITIVDVAIGSGNEQFNREVATDCYYRGHLTDEVFNAIPDTHAFINLCDTSLPFIGFVSNSYNVYVIARNNDSPTGIDMVIDNQNQPVIYEGISPIQGEPNYSIPAGLYPRQGNPSLFPSIEIAVEPAYVAKFGENAYVDRIVESLAFANFVFEQSGMKQLSLIGISLLDQNVIWSGGSGSVRSNIHDLRMRTAQANGADMLLVYLGSNVNTTYLWGWGEKGYACDLQRAVAEGLSVNTVNIGRSSGYLTPLPSLIQRGWLITHEAAHILNSPHVKQDPLMDAYFQYLPALADYKAGCETISDMYESCAFNPKNWKFTDYYSCN